MTGLARVAIFISGMLIAASCVSTGTGHADAAYSSSPAEFLNGFEISVTRRDWSAARVYLDPAYVAEQHDQMLEGRTDQFFVELLGLYKLCSGQPHANCLSRVLWIRRQRTPGVAPGSDVPVRFLIMLDGETKPISITLYLKFGPTPRKFSLFGAVG